MPELKLSKVNKLGDADPKYGQSWWGEVNQDKPVMFNTMSGEFSDGCVIEYEERVEKVSKSEKKTPYWRLRKVSLKEAGVITAADTSVGSSGKPPAALQGFSPEIEKMIREIHESVVGTPVSPKADVLPTDAEVLGGTEVDLSDIPY